MEASPITYPWTAKERDMIEQRIERALDLALTCGLRGVDDWCYLEARIAANHAFSLEPQLREPSTWKHPAALQFRGKIGEEWRPGR